MLACMCTSMCACVRGKSGKSWAHSHVTVTLYLRYRELPVETLVYGGLECLKFCLSWFKHLKVRALELFTVWCHREQRQHRHRWYLRWCCARWKAIDDRSQWRQETRDNSRQLVWDPSREDHEFLVLTEGDMESQWQFVEAWESACAETRTHTHVHFNGM